MSSDPQPDFRQVLRQRIDRGDIGAFEWLYANANQDAAQIPWADLRANPNVTQWLDRQQLAGHGRRALVVGCGLGDDAEELERRGFDVTAFDVAPTAIEWCRRRFADSRVKFMQADLLAPPAEWARAFQFVLEVYTIQAMPLNLREPALRRLADFVAPGGVLLVVCRGRDDDAPHGELPYPLSRAELDLLRQAGLVEQSFEDYMDDRETPVRRFRVAYTR